MGIRGEMEILIGDEADLAHAVAKRVSRILNAESRPRIGLATGKSLRHSYEILHALHQDQHIRLTDATWVMLDEYLGLPIGHERTFEMELRRSLFAGLPLDGVDLISPLARDTSVEDNLRAFRALINAEPVHLQLLGIGRNGHIAFNEPGSDFASTARVIALSQATRDDMVRDGWDEAESPSHAVTQGLSDIMLAREVVLLALGEAKIEPIRRAFREPPSSSCPASVLQGHPNVKLFLTPEVARGLR